MPCRQKRLPVSVVLRTFDSRNVCQLVLKGRNGLALNDTTRQGIVNVLKMEKRAAIQIRMLEALCPQTRDIPYFHGRSLWKEILNMRMGMGGICLMQEA